MPRSEIEVDVGAEDAERLGIHDQRRLGVPPAIGGLDVVILGDRRPSTARRPVLRRCGGRSRQQVPASPGSTSTYTRQTDIRIEISAPNSISSVYGLPIGTGCALGEGAGACWEARHATIPEISDLKSTDFDESTISRSPIDDSSSDSPGVIAAIQAAHIHPSTAGWGLVQLAEQSRTPSAKARTASIKPRLMRFPPWPAPVRR